MLQFLKRFSWHLEVPHPKACQENGSAQCSPGTARCIKGWVPRCWQWRSGKVKKISFHIKWAITHYIEFVWAARNAALHKWLYVLKWYTTYRVRSFTLAAVVHSALISSYGNARNGLKLFFPTVMHHLQDFPTFCRNPFVTCKFKIVNRTFLSQVLSQAVWKVTPLPEQTSTNQTNIRFRYARRVQWHWIETSSTLCKLVMTRHTQTAGLNESCGAFVVWRFFSFNSPLTTLFPAIHFLFTAKKNKKNERKTVVSSYPAMYDISLNVRRNIMNIKRRIGGR